jgi:hypothetical protein
MYVCEIWSRFFLYEIQCEGLQFETDLFFQLYVPFVWDAVMTFAHALSSLIKAGKNYSGLELLKQVKVTSFEGLTGE